MCHKIWRAEAATSNHSALACLLAAPRLAEARADLALRGRGDYEANDEAVKSKGLGEDKNQDHADEELRLLGVSAHACIADDADGQAGSQGAEANREASGEVRIALVGRVGRFDLAVDDDGGDEAVDTKDASHDNWDDGAHDHVWAHNAHAGDADTRLGRAVGCSEVGEDDGGSDAHHAEEVGRWFAHLKLWHLERGC